MPTWSIVMIVILVVLIAAVIALYIWGKKLEKRQAEQKEQIDAAAQQVTMLVIDKGKLKLKDAGLPPIVMDQANFMMKRSKLPIVKAKVGPRMMTFIAEASIYEMIPVKKEVKATVSGLYITGVKGVRGSIEKPQGKKKLRQRLAEKYRKVSDQAAAEGKASKAKKEAKAAKKSK